MLTTLHSEHRRILCVVFGSVLLLAAIAPSVISAPPPVPTIVQSSTGDGKIAVRWCGAVSETARDPGTSRIDFEGYRVYISPSASLGDFVMTASRDGVNFLQYEWRLGSSEWVLHDPPLTLDSLKTLYDALTDSVYGFPFHPDSFTTPEFEQALLAIKVNPDDSNVLDTFFDYFQWFGDNATPDDKALEFQVDSLGLEVTRVIRKAYPYTLPTDSLMGSDGTWILPYYIYEFALDSLSPDTTIYVSVTAFDHGDPPTGGSSEESPILDNVVVLVPTGLAALDSSVRPRALQLMQNYPNPFNAGTQIRFEIGRASPVELATHNLLGRQVATVFAGVLAAGRHEYGWNGLGSNGSELPTGVYFYVLKAGTSTQARRMALLK